MQENLQEKSGIAYIYLKKKNGHFSKRMELKHSILERELK